MIQDRHDLNCKIRCGPCGVEFTKPPNEIFKKRRGTGKIVMVGTVPIKSIRRSQVTGLLNLTKSHSGHTKNHQKSQKRVQK